MASVYILYSPSCNQYYTGSCKELAKRLEQHILGNISGAFTSKAVDLYLSLNELGYEQARKIETHIKKMKSRKYIENLKKYNDMAQKLIEMYKLKKI